MSELLELDVSGTDPVGHARKALQQYADETLVESVSIRISIEEPTMEMPPPESDTREERSMSTGAHQSVGEDREKGNVSPDTSHHRVLSALQEVADGESVPAKDVQEQVTGVAETSVHPALTQLWERQLVTRERVDDVTHPYYTYELTEHGRRTLSELGEPAEPSSQD